MCQLMTDRESLAFRPIGRIYADVVLAPGAKRPARFLGTQIVLHPEYRFGFFDVSLNPNGYAARICFAHKLPRLYDCSEFIH
jgi:hypothetical protein